MAKNLFVVSQIPNLPNLLRNEIKKRLTHAKGHLDGVNVVEVKLTQKGEERSFLASLNLVDEDFQQLSGAQIVLVDNNLLPALINAIDTDKHRSNLSSIRWVQNTWAGVDSLFKDQKIADIVKRNGLTLTRFSGPHFGHSMADYVLGQLINYERSFYYLHTVTKVQKQWRTFDWFDPIVESYRRTDELSAVVLGGTGAIGSYVATKLLGMNMKVSIYGRHERTQSELDQLYKSGVTKYSTKLEDLLPHVDYIISIMPSTPATNDLLGNDVLSMCKEKRPVLINVGRGNVISEEDIVKALDQGWIRHAILDVFRTEPLPRESPLWSRDDVHITPHVSANTRGIDVVDLFVDNYLNYVEQKPLKYVIDFDSGY